MSDGWLFWRRSMMPRPGGHFRGEGRIKRGRDGLIGKSWEAEAPLLAAVLRSPAVRRVARSSPTAGREPCCVVCLILGA